MIAASALTTVSPFHNGRADDPLERRDVNPRRHPSNDRCNDVGDERGDDLPESGAYDNADCQVDDISFYRELFEFLKHTRCYRPFLSTYRMNELL